MCSQQHDAIILTWTLCVSQCRNAAYIYGLTGFQFNVLGGRECLNEFRYEMHASLQISVFSFLCLVFSKGSDFSPIIPYLTDLFLFLREKYVGQTMCLEEALV